MNPLATSPADRARSGGFTLLELLVTLTLIAMVFAIVVPNLGALVPSTRLQGSGKQILRTLDWARSESRIQARQMTLEFDLDRNRWRVVHPPEMRISLEQLEADLEEWAFDWNQLEDGVVFAGVGDRKQGMAEKGTYKMVFDEYGFTSDQLLVLRLKTDSQLVWAVTLRGLTGAVTVFESEQGQVPELTNAEEGAF